MVAVRSSTKADARCPAFDEDPFTEVGAYGALAPSKKPPQPPEFASRHGEDVVV